MQQWFEANSPVDGEDLERHDKWLCMMWPRLNLLRDLLSDDGVIFVSIDDNEQHHLRMMMDEVFGEENFVEGLVWKKKGGASNTERIIGRITENILLYSKDISSVATNRRVIENVSYPFSDDGGSYKLEPLTKTDEGMYRRDTMKFGVPVPSMSSTAYPGAGKRWIVGKALMMSLLAAGQLHFERKNDGWKVRRKRYFDESDPRTGVYLNLLLENGSLAVAKNELQRLGFRREEFDTPKPSSLISHLLRVVTSPNDIILDSFAGSGTTAHAVLALNKEDDGNRKFILVECEDYADDITAERVRRVINGVPTARDQTLREGLGGEFTYCELGDPISIEGMLNGDLPEYSDVARMTIHNATGLAPNDIPINYDGDLGFVYESETTRYHLLYRDDVEWLRGEDGALNYHKARRISNAAKEVSKTAIVFATARFMSQRDLTALGITFCQLPYDLTSPRLKSLQT